MSRHIARKGAFFYTHTWDRTFGERVGMFPKHPKTTENRMRRAGTFMKAMEKNMKNQNVGTIYRGLKGYQSQIFEKSGEITSKTFSSFSKDVDVAVKFARMGSGTIVLKIEGRVPSIVYNQVRYISKYYNEQEVLLPPGKFIQDPKQSTRGLKGVTIIPVIFQPQKLNVPNVPRTNRNMNDNMNTWWRKFKVYQLMKEKREIENVNIPRLNKMITKSPKNEILKKMRTRLNNHIKSIKTRINRLNK